MKTYDVAVIGVGVFGAWTALQLARRGKRVVLLEAYGPGHSRSSSGDESRIIRMGYGRDEIYTRWSQRSLAQWKELFAATRDEALFQQTGLDGIRSAILEPQSGVLMARRAVTATVAEAGRRGTTYVHALVEQPKAKGPLRAIKTKSGEEISAGQFVFACGAWLAKLFPDVVSPRVFMTRQEAFYYGLPAGE